LGTILVTAVILLGLRWRAAQRTVQLPEAVGWKVGTQVTYKVRWEAEHAVRIAAPQSANGLHAKADIGGELVVRVLGRRGEHLLLAVQLKNVHRHGYQMFDQDWLENPDAATQQLEGRELVVEVARHGRLVRVHRRPNEDKLFASILQSVLLRAQFSLPKTAAVTWKGVESTTTGVSNVVYEVTSQQPLVLRRTRTHYDTIQGLPPMPSSQERQQLEALASIELDRDGVPTHLRDKEKLAVFKGNSAEAMLESSSDLELTKIAEEPMQGEREIAMSGWVGTQRCQRWTSSRWAGRNWSDLRGMVVSGQTSLSSDSHMATLLGRHAGSSGRVQQALVFLLARNQDNPQVASKIVMALRGAAS
jgi:hypothetical protein